MMSKLQNTSLQKHVINALWSNWKKFSLKDEVEEQLDTFFCFDGGIFLHYSTMMYCLPKVYPK